MISGTSAGFGRRLAALIYDSVLLAALLIVYTAALVFAHGGAADRSRPRAAGGMRTAAAKSSLIAGYYVLNWTRSGQTLGMRAWHLRAVSDIGQTAEFAPAVLRVRLRAWSRGRRPRSVCCGCTSTLITWRCTTGCRTPACCTYRVLEIAMSVHRPITAVGSQPTSAGFKPNSCPPFSMVPVMRKNTTPSITPITVRVPAPVVRNGPNTNGNASSVTMMTANMRAMRDQ